MLQRIGIIVAVALVMAMAPLDAQAAHMNVGYGKVVKLKFDNGKKYGATEFQLDFNHGDWETPGYCIEIEATTRKGGHSANLVDLADYTKFDQQDLKKAAWVFKTWSPGVQEAKDKKGIMGAAVQASIWSLLYGYDLNTSWRKNKSTYKDVYAMYDEIMGDMHRFDERVIHDVMVAKVDSTQDMLVTKPVPLPGAVWLLGAGCIGLTGLRRRLIN